MLSSDSSGTSGSLLPVTSPPPGRLVLTLNLRDPYALIGHDFSQTISSSSYSEYPFLPQLAHLVISLLFLTFPRTMPSFIASLQRTFYNSIGCKPFSQEREC